MPSSESITDVRVSANGRMVLPLSVRKAIGISGEARVIVTVEGDEVRLSPIKHVVTRLQGLYREHAINDADTEAFLEERRQDEGSER